MPASCLTQQLLYKPSISWPEVARWAITGIYWEWMKHMDLNWNEERVHLIQLWSQIWHLRQLAPRTCCPSLAFNDHPSSSWNNSLLRARQSCHWSGNPFTLRKIFFFSRQSLPRPYLPVSSLVWQSWRGGELACWISGKKRWPNCQPIGWLDFWVTSIWFIARCPQPGPPASVSGHSLLLSATALCRQDSGLPICPFAGSSREPAVQETLFDLLAATSGSSSWHTWGQGQTPGSRQHFNSWGDS